MKVPSLRRLFNTDFPAEYKALVDQLAEVLNINLEVLYEALNRKLTIDENFQATVKELDITVGTDGRPTSSTTFKLSSGSAKIQEVRVGQYTNVSNSALFPTSGVSISWNQDGETLSINHITGIAPTSGNATWRIRLIAQA